MPTTILDIPRIFVACIYSILKTHMNKIIRFIQQIAWKDTKVLLTSGVLLASMIGVSTVFALTRSGTGSTTPDTSIINTPDLSSLVGIVGYEGATSSTGTAGPSNSWPGEIVSSEISQIQSQREGIVIEWRVGVGEKVLAGQVLGKISAPPATPELTKMLAEQTESVSRARARATVTDTYTQKEQTRLAALRDSIGNTSPLDPELSFTVLEKLRAVVESKKTTLRASVERALAGQVLTVTNFTDWRYVRFSGLNRQYGVFNQSVQNAYETALIQLADSLKSSQDLQVDIASQYFALAVRLANSSPDDPALNGFKTMVVADQKEFLDMLAQYKDAQTAVADKETEYRNMIGEQNAMLDKERSMAHAEASAAEAAYKTVSGEITGGTYIRAPRSGFVSAIYKKVGDLVDPTMSVAVIAGYGSDNLIVRMHIPSNVRKPKVGDVVSVVRPGFPKDAHTAKVAGVGISLDSVGSYMADATLTDHVDWPVEAAVRVVASEDSSAPIIKFSAIWWSETGIPHVWGVSDIGRIYAKKVVLGRTFGSSVEVYGGLKNGDKYVLSPTADMQEDTLLQNKEPGRVQEGNSTKSSDGMGGMPM